MRRPQSNYGSSETPSRNRYNRQPTVSIRVVRETRGIQKVRLAGNTAILKYREVNLLKVFAL